MAISDRDLEEAIEREEEINYSFAVRGIARELIPNEVLADEWWQRGQRNLEELLEQI